MNLTFQNLFNSVKQTASEDITLRSSFACSHLSFPKDVDIKIDSVTKLQTELENGAVVSSSVQIPELLFSHITRIFPTNDRFPTRTPLYKRSKHACEFHTSIYKQLLFTHFLLFFRCSSLLYLLVPSPHRPPRLLPLRAPLPSIHTLSDRH